MDSIDTRGHDVADICRAMVRAEGEAMHRWMSWLATLQGFLFAGVGGAWKSADSRLLVGVISLLGLTAAVYSCSCPSLARMWQFCESACRVGAVPTKPTIKKGAVVGPVGSVSELPDK